MHLKDFTVLRTIGKGSFSHVYQVRSHLSLHSLALKVIDLANMSLDDRQINAKSAQLTSNINSPYLLTPLQVFLDKEQFCLLMPLAERDLQSLITQRSQKSEPLSQNQIWIIFTQILRGLADLHSHNLLHKDLKASNILVFPGNVIKIGDFNLSGHPGNHRTIGTPAILSPQILKQNKYTEKSDIWALGCLLYQLMTFKLPFQGKDLEQLNDRISKCMLKRVKPNYSIQMTSLLRNMLSISPASRPSCTKLLSLHLINSRFEQQLAHLPQQKIRLKPIKSVRSTIDHSSDQRRSKIESGQLGRSRLALIHQRIRRSPPLYSINSKLQVLKTQRLRLPSIA